MRPFWRTENLMYNKKHMKFMWAEDLDDLGLVSGDPILLCHRSDRTTVPRFYQGLKDGKLYFSRGPHHDDAGDDHIDLSDIFILPLEPNGQQKPKRGDVVLVYEEGRGSLNIYESFDATHEVISCGRGTTSDGHVAGVTRRNLNGARIVPLTARRYDPNEYS